MDKVKGTCTPEALATCGALPQEVRSGHLLGDLSACGDPVPLSGLRTSSCAIPLITWTTGFFQEVTWAALPSYYCSVKLSLVNVFLGNTCFYRIPSHCFH